MTKYILYADDDIDDQENLEDSLQEIAPDISLKTVQSGVDLLDFLDNLPPGSSLPCLVLADMNMPRVNGLETLKRLKAHPLYSKLPVIIFSTGGNDTWQQTAKELGAEDYVLKPITLDKMRQVARHFANHCDLVVPPAKE